MTTPVLDRGDIVLTRFPFTDLKGSSLRPALIVSDGMIGQDVILLGISSVLRGSQSSTDLMVGPAHAEFVSTGLRFPSVFRAHKLVTVERSVVVRRLGHASPLLLSNVDRLLRQVLQL